jgi:predicted enzyme related to lactoylglutathione lyase
MNHHHQINYLEIPTKDLNATKSFFEKAFGWTFLDYGPEYSCFLNVGIDGGFFLAPTASVTDQGAALIVLYSSDLEESLAKVELAGGIIIKPVFEFPGGRRFQFLDPAGNEYAVWSE